MNTKSTKLLSLIGLVVLISTTGFIFQGCSGREDETTNAITSATQTTSEQARPRCPVCGMYADMTPYWQAKIEYKDGTSLQFDVPEHMLAFYVEPAAHKASDYQKDRNHIARITVTDYNSKAAIDAREALYVIGSKVKSPMGEGVISFKSRMEAAQFQARQGGRIVGFNEFTPELVKTVQ